MEDMMREMNESRQVTDSKAKQLLADKSELDPTLTQIGHAHCNGKYDEQFNRPQRFVMKLHRFKDKEGFLKRG